MKPAAPAAAPAAIDDYEPPLHWLLGAAKTTFVKFGGWLWLLLLLAAAYAYWRLKRRLNARHRKNARGDEYSDEND